MFAHVETLPSMEVHCERRTDAFKVLIQHYT